MTFDGVSLVDVDDRADSAVLTLHSPQNINPWLRLLGKRPWVKTLNVFIMCGL